MPYTILFLESDLEDLAEKIRPHTAKTTRIEMAPWAKAYTVDMKDIYTDLSLEKIENEPTGPEGKRIEDYKEFFEGESETKKVLMKGDPGMGKTTVSKKISWDWAVGLFKMFTLVFFVSLKLVKPGDVIENIIIQQTPALESLSIRQKQLGNILEKFGHRCLLILDGIDEIDLKKNDEVRRVIRGNKLVYCNVLVTSRPHSAAEIEGYFNTIVHVQGFVKSQAERYVSSVLDVKHKSTPVMQFYYTNFREADAKFASPMLLLFICILVNADEIDLKQKNVTQGEIYTRLVRCLYRKFTVRKGIKYIRKDFEKVLKKLGKLAWKTLNSKEYHLCTSEIVDDVGEDAFEYGVLVGHEDFRLLGHAMADVFVTFLHSSIQEFFGSYYFMKKLNVGKPIESLSHIDSVWPIFMVDPLFLYFCLYFLHEKQDYFDFKKSNLYRVLAQFMSEKFDMTQLELADVERLYPALEITNRKKLTKELGKNILTEALAFCNRTNEIIIRHEGLLNEMFDYCPMTNVKNVRSVDRFLPVTSPFSLLRKQESGDEFSVVISHSDYGSIDELMWFCESEGKKPSLYIQPTTEETDICEYVKGCVQKVHICRSVAWRDEFITVTAKHDIGFCPFLTHLCLMHLAVAPPVLDTLSKASENGKLPSLRYLGFEGNVGSSLMGQLSMLFESKWPALTCLNLKGCWLAESDIWSIACCLVEPGNQKFPKLKSLIVNLGDTITEDSVVANLSSPGWSMFYFLLGTIDLQRLYIYNMDELVYEKFMSTVYGSRLQNLLKLVISFIKGDHSFFNIRTHVANLPKLTELRLQRFVHSSRHLSTVAKSALSFSLLEKLDISSSTGITGNLSVLLRETFPSLHSLFLSDCGLNFDDLRSLAQASVEDQLPELRHLDISENRNTVDHLENLFYKQCKWEKIHTFNIENQDFNSVKDVKLLARKFTSGCLRALQKLKISSFRQDSVFRRMTTPLANLQHIETSCDAKIIGELLNSISDAIEADLLPVLETITMFLTSQNMPSTTADIQKFKDDLHASADKMIRIQFYLIRKHLLKPITLDASQVSVLASFACLSAEERLATVESSFGPIVRERLSSAFPKVHTESMNTLFSSICTSVATWLPSEIASGESSLSQPQESRTQLKSVLECLDTVLKRSFIQVFTGIIQDPSVFTHFAASVYSSVYPWLTYAFNMYNDRNLYESVAVEFTKKLVEMLPELLSGPESNASLKKLLKVSLCPIIAEKYAEQAGVPFTDELVSLFKEEVTGSFIDVQAVAQMEASFWSSAVKWKLRQRGISIYFSQQPDVDYKLVDEGDDFQEKMQYGDKSTKYESTESSGLLRPNGQDNIDKYEANVSDNTSHVPEGKTVKGQDKEHVLEVDSVVSSFHEEIDKRQAFWLFYQEFSTSLKQIFDSVLISLRNTLYSECSPDFSEVHVVVDSLKPLRDWLPFNFPEIDEEILRHVGLSVANALSHCLSVNQATETDFNMVKSVSSQEHSPPGTQLETMEIQSVVIAIASQVHEYLIRCHHYRTTGEVQRHQVPIEQFLDSLDPPVTDRLKSAFPCMDPELLESVANTFAEDFCGYLIDFLIGTAAWKRLEVPLLPLLAAKTSHILGVETLEEETHVQNLQDSANAMIASILAELTQLLYHRSFLSSGVTGLIANLDPKISDTLLEAFPELDPVGLDLLSETVSSISNEYLSFKIQSGKRSLAKYILSKQDVPLGNNFDCTKLESVVESIEVQIQDLFRFYADDMKDPSFAKELVASLDPPVFDRISSVFPNANQLVMESVTEKFTENLIGNLIHLLRSTYDHKVLNVPLIPLLLDKNAELVDEDAEVSRQSIEQKSSKTEAARSGNEKHWDLAADTVRLILQPIQRRFYDQLFLDSALTQSLNVAVRSELFNVFPDWGDDHLDETTKSTVTSVVNGLSSEDVSKTLQPGEYTISSVNKALQHLDGEPYSFVHDAVVTSLNQHIDQALSDMRQKPSVAADLMAFLDVPVIDRISNMFPDKDPIIWESVAVEITGTLTKKLPDLLAGSDMAFKELQCIIAVLFPSKQQNQGDSTKWKANLSLLKDKRWDFLK